MEEFLDIQGQKKLSVFAACPLLVPALICPVTVAAPRVAVSDSSPHLALPWG